MSRWKLAIGGGILALICNTSARAQGPTAGSTGMQFVPINTTQNLAAPIPVRVVPKKSVWQRVKDSANRLNPLASSQAVTPAPAKAPNKAPAPQSSTGILPRMPRVTDFITGGVK